MAGLPDAGKRIGQVNHIRFAKLKTTETEMLRSIVPSLVTQEAELYFVFRLLLIVQCICDIDEAIARLTVPLTVTVTGSSSGPNAKTYDVRHVDTTKPLSEGPYSMNMISGVSI